MGEEGNQSKVRGEREQDPVAPALQHCMLRYWHDQDHAAFSGLTNGPGKIDWWGLGDQQWAPIKLMLQSSALDLSIWHSQAEVSGSR